MNKRPARRRGDAQRARAKKDELKATEDAAIKVITENESRIQACCPKSAMEKSKNGIPSNSKYNKESVMAVMRLLAQGHTQESAAAIVGVTGTTLSKWRAKYKDFDEACDISKNLCQAVLINALWRHVDKNPRTAEYLLERRFPKDFAQTKRVDGQMTHAHTHGPNQLLETLHRERLKLDTSKAADTSSVVSDAQVVDVEPISDDGGGREGSVPI